jgi:hypothetical protein
VAYAARFDLPVRTGVRVDGLSRFEDRFVVTSGDRRFEAHNVVVASGAYHNPRFRCSRRAWIRRSCRHTRANTAIPPNCKKAAFSS